MTRPPKPKPKKPSAEAARLERIATAALAGLLAGRHGFLVDCGTDNAADWAVQAAERLIEKLDKHEQRARAGKRQIGARP